MSKLINHSNLNFRLLSVCMLLLCVCMQTKAWDSEANLTIIMIVLPISLILFSLHSGQMPSAILSKLWAAKVVLCQQVLSLIFLTILLAIRNMPILCLAAVFCQEQNNAFGDFLFAIIFSFVVFCLSLRLL